MAEMRVAFLAAHFCARHAQSPIGRCFDIFFSNGRREARPARARFEFRLGAEKRIAAAYAPIDPFVMQIVILAGECAFCAGMARHFKLRIA